MRRICLEQIQSQHSSSNNNGDPGNRCFTASIVRHKLEGELMDKNRAEAEIESQPRDN